MSADLTAPEVVASTGVTYRQLDYWTSNGWLRVRRGVANPGSGRQRAYTAHEAKVARHMADLVRVGVAPEQAARTARQLARSGRARLGLFRLEAAA